MLESSKLLFEKLDDLDNYFQKIKVKKKYFLEQAKVMQNSTIFSGRNQVVIQVVAYYINLFYQFF